MLRVKELMADIFRIKVDEVGEDTSMQTVRGWDSLKHMSLIAALEEEFGGEPLAIDDIVVMTSYPAIVDVLRKRGVSE